MKVCIFGAGAVGGHLAAKLARGGLDVSVVARGPHLRAIQDDGLTLTSPKETFNVRVRATDNPAELGVQDLVITALKAHSLPAAADGIGQLLDADTPVVFAANGVPWWYFYGAGGEFDGRPLPRLDPDGVLARRIGLHRVIGAVIRSPNEVVRPGVIEARAENNALVLGELDGAITERLTRYCETLSAHFGAVTPTSDIRTAVWDKLLVNVVTSPMACLALATSKDIADDPDLVALYRKLAQECIAIAARLGITLKPDIETLLRRGREFAHKPSMLQDLLAGRPLEIDAQLLAVQDIARLVGVDTPLMDALFALLKVRARQHGD
ncbi:2-dehydropantoate 2-reductase [Bordetella sputigena]|uniref:ketopantoate reductase family protein n=1 Tax=Bordetella sputigena TaxID=1416810 RepID=UPI0039EF82A4